jgi:hypothetical protein
VELPNKIALFVTVFIPVPPLFACRGDEIVIELATIATLTIELAVIATVVAFVTRPLEFKYRYAVDNLKEA